MQISDLCACFYIRNGGRRQPSIDNSVTDEHQAPSGMIEHSRARLSFPRESHPCPFGRMSGGIDITSE